MLHALQREYISDKNQLLMDCRAGLAAAMAGGLGLAVETGGGRSRGSCSIAAAAAAASAADVVSSMLLDSSGILRLPPSCEAG